MLDIPAKDNAEEPDSISSRTAMSETREQAIGVPAEPGRAMPQMSARAGRAADGASRRRVLGRRPAVGPPKAGGWAIQPTQSQTPHTP